MEELVVLGILICTVTVDANAHISPQTYRTM